MKIRIKTYNGELSGYLTKGEDYNQVGVDHNYPDIIDDDGDDTFDDQIYKMTNGEDFDDQFVQDWFDHFKAGQQSQQGEVDKLQTEIDELQARIDKALERMDAESSNSWGLWKEKADMYEQGASDAYEKSYWILKGNKDEN